MRNRRTIVGFAVLAAVAAISPLGHAFTITPTFSTNTTQAWDANSMAIVNQAINDWTSVLSYTGPNQNIDMSFQFLDGGSDPFNSMTYLGSWRGIINSPPTGTNVFPSTPEVNHLVKINSDLMTVRNGGVNYPDYLVLAFTSAPPTANQWDALTVIRHNIGQALGFSMLYVDSYGNSLANKWQDQVTVTGSNAVFDQTPGGLNIPLVSSNNVTQFADPTDLMGLGNGPSALPLATRLAPSFQDFEALSLAYNYAITVNAGTSYNSTTFKTQTITMNGSVLVAPSSATRQTPGITLSAQNITFGAAGFLDISNHDLIIHGGSTLAQVQALVAAGRGNGSFNGTTGITSSTAAAHGLNLGVGTAGAANITTFDGVPVSPSDILVKYTYAGDANLDAHIDLTDLSTVLNHFGQTTANWTDGNFDGAATIDLTDLSAVLNNFGRSVPQGSIATPSATQTLAMAAPEPTSLAILAGAAPVLLRRKTRRA
ncbi:MAG TPA: hypothetical protein VM008_19025 [Phycisphaerae bacterium]|nr:hypothetical protein [Phycisphaerae bacterium]